MIEFPENHYLNIPGAGWLGVFAKFADAKDEFTSTYFPLFLTTK